MKEMIAAALRQAGVSAAMRTLSPVAPIVSPMCRAADWICVHVTTDDDAWFVKLAAPDAAPWVSVRDAAAGAAVAASVGVAPALRFAQTGVLVFAALPPPWREARLGDLATPDVLEAVLSAKRGLHRSSVRLRTWDVFAQIEALAAELPNKPQDMQWMLEEIGRIRAAIDAAGRDSVPCHADGVVSNIMVGPDGAVMLVDFDCAGMADPHYDLGIVLNEACALEAQWQTGLEIAFGRVTARDRNRCAAFAIADDLLWGLWGLSRHQVSPRQDLEFLKYGSWRLLRCRMALQSDGHAERLGNL